MSVINDGKISKLKYLQKEEFYLLCIRPKNKLFSFFSPRLVYFRCIGIPSTRSVHIFSYFLSRLERISLCDVEKNITTTEITLATVSFFALPDLPNFDYQSGLWSLRGRLTANEHTSPVYQQLTTNAERSESQKAESWTA